MLRRFCLSVCSSCGSTVEPYQKPVLLMREQVFELAALVEVKSHPQCRQNLIIKNCDALRCAAPVHSPSSICHVRRFTCASCCAAALLFMRSLRISMPASCVDPELQRRSMAAYICRPASSMRLNWSRKQTVPSGIPSEMVASDENGKGLPQTGSGCQGFPESQMPPRWRASGH